MLNHALTSIEPTKMFSKLKYLQEDIVSQEIKESHSTY